jgi:outer membrane protein
MKEKCWSFVVCSMLLFGFSSLTSAADLLEVYRQALENDPIFKAAYSTYMSSTESIPQARSALLPQLTLGGAVARNILTINVLEAQNTTTPYSSTLWTVNATQALFNYQSWVKVQQAKASVKASLATFNNAAQDLMLRTAKAYLDVLLSKDTLNFVEAKKRANKRQLEQAQQRFNVGLDAITSVYEAKAAYDQSVADVISAQNNQINKSESLRKLTNHVYDQLAPLRNSTIPLIKPEPNNVNEWVATGLKQNYNLFAAKYNMQAARENIKSQSSGSWPTVSLQGSTAQTRNFGSNDNFFIPNNNILSNVTVAMNFPVFQGGLIHANTKQAQYDFQTSSEQMEQTYRNVVVNSTIAFNTIIDGISKVKADRQAIISRKNSLESLDAQFQVGTRTMVDVVTAQQRLFEAQEQLASDQYGLINAILNLKYLSGSLNVNDLEEINSWMATTRINGLPPAQKITHAIHSRVIAQQH